MKWKIIWKEVNDIELFQKKFLRIILKFSYDELTIIQTIFFEICEILQILDSVELYFLYDVDMSLLLLQNMLYFWEDPHSYQLLGHCHEVQVRFLLVQTYRTLHHILLGLLYGALASMIFLRNKLPSLLHSKNM